MSQLQVANLHFTLDGSTRIDMPTPNTTRITINSANTVYINPTRTVFNHKMNVSNGISISGNLVIGGGSTGGEFGLVIPFTPTLEFGVGGNTGIVYDTQTTSGLCFVNGARVVVVGRLRLSNKGTSSGAARIRCPGIPAIGTVWGGGTIMVPYWGGMASNVQVAGYISNEESVPTISLNHTGVGASVTGFTEAHFNNDGDLMFTGHYVRSA